MSKINANNRDLATNTRKRTKTQVFKYQYYFNQFSTQEQKTINQALNILSRECSQQKETLNYDEAKFVCYYFFSVYEISRKDFSLLDKELIQLYHDDSQMKEVRSIIDVILNVKKNQPVLEIRSMGQISDSDLADNLSDKQIIQAEKSWTTFDEEEEGFINGNDAERPVLHLLSCYGYDENHPNFNEIKEMIENWKQKTSFYLFFNEYACLICEINSKFPLLKKGQNKQSCACNIF